MNRPARSLAAASALVLALQTAPIPAQSPPAPPDDQAELDDAAEAPPEGVAAAGEAVHHGDPFPPFRLSVLKPGRTVPDPLDLGADLGKRPIVFFYFKIGNPLSEEIYQEVQQMIEEEVAGKVALYPVVVLGRRFELTELYERMNLLGIRHPVILDEDRRIQSALNMHHVPHLALINSFGELSFSGARSLGHPAYGELTTREAILMASRGERPPARRLWRYYPAIDLIGQHYKDLTLPGFGSKESLRLSDFVKPGKLTALFYWSPRCPFSKRVMPGMVMAQRTFAEKYLNVLSVVRDGTDEEVRGFAEEAGINFPIARNRDSRFSAGYRIISTPTLILVSPDGRIDSVYTSGKINLFPVIRTKIERVLLGISPPAAAAPPSG